MAQKSIKKNYLYNVSYQILTILTPLITTPYIARVLGVDDIGVYSFTAAAVSYFAMAAALGTARQGEREVAYCQNDKEKRSVVFWRTETLCACSTLVCTAAFLIYAAFWVRSENRVYYLAQIFTVLAVATDITWYFQGLEEFGRIIARNTVIKLLMVAFIFLFVREKEDLLLYIGGLSMLILLSGLSLWPSLRGSVRRPGREVFTFYKVLPDAIGLFIPTVAISIYTVFDKIMIGLITKSPAENGYYEQGLSVARAFLVLVTSLGVVMLPRIGHYFHEKNLEAMRTYMYKSYRFVWLLGIPFCLGLASVAPIFVPWYYGPGYDKVVPLLQAASFLILAVGINTVTGTQYLVPTKRERQYTVSVALGAVVNVILNWFLIQAFQSVGAAAASVAAEVVIAAFQLWIVRREISGIEVLRYSWKYAASGLLMAACIRLIRMAMGDSVGTMFVMIIVGGIVYTATLFLLKDDFFIGQVRAVAARVRR